LFKGNVGCLFEPAEELHRRFFQSPINRRLEAEVSSGLQPLDMAVDLERGPQLETQALKDILPLQHQHAATVHLLENQTKHYTPSISQEDSSEDM
jgi:hypothetical protein